MKLGKKSKFNLSDGDEEEDEFGSSALGSFGGRDDFEDEMPFDDEDGGEQDGWRSMFLTDLLFSNRRLLSLPL